jgi:endogenous inhibitor of DNA gyrase (YacG/DUF329 family)
MKCANPTCTNEVKVPETWKKQHKKFCSDRCRKDIWVIREALKKLLKMYGG